LEQRPHPTQIELDRKARVLAIDYDDGARFRLPCEYLRVLSPSAEVRGHSPATARLQVGKESVTIDDIRPVGNYAVKLCFSDGHDSGLYDWQYLYRLGRAWQPLWFDYLERLAAAGQARNAPDPFDELKARGERPSQLPATPPAG
jgi:DUF971 family protein